MTGTALEALKQKMNDELAQMANTVAPPSSNKISLRGKVFTLPDGTTNQGPLEAVILDHINFNAYYKKPYDPQNPVAPDCFALAKVISDMKPHEDSGEPQNEDCISCQWNQFGSASQGKGKACRNKIRIAIVPPDAGEDDDPMTIELPPSSLKTWNAYVNQLRGRGLLPVQMVTAISFDANSPYPTLKFAASSMHDEVEKFWAIKERSSAYLEQVPAAR